jgi:hypothetical protein
MVGQQRLSSIRSRITLAMVPLLLALLGFVSRRHVERLSRLAGGVAVDAAIGVCGLRLMRFEVTPLGLLYTPDLYPGIALSSPSIAVTGNTPQPCP